MKRSKIINLLILLSISFGSCLDLDPQDQLGGGAMWQDANQFKLFSNQFYGWTRSFSTMVYDGPYSDQRSDLLTSDVKNLISNGTNTIPVTDNNYKDNYDRIRRTNLLLKNAENYPNQRDIAKYIAEAKFFRAYCYFDLVQLYGDVIITKEPLDMSSPEITASRNPRQEVIDFIIQDLHEAAPDLPLASGMNADDAGRVSRGAAQAFLSRVALYEGTWQQFRDNLERGKTLLDIAAKAAKDVMDSKEYSLFTALGTMSYKYLFILENEKSNPLGLKKDANKEYVFARRYDETLNRIGQNITKHTQANVQWVTAKMANMYLTQAGVPIDQNNNANYQNMNSEFQNRDNRMTNTLMEPGKPYWNNDNPRITWLGDEADIAGAYVQSFNSAALSGYHNQKWATERKLVTLNEGYDFPIIRYAEVLLNYAEAVYERDGNISDADLDISLNLVRGRVNPSMPKLSANLVAGNNLNMRVEIHRERTVEFFNEGFRLNDLKRWKTAETEMPMNTLGIKWTGTEFQTKWGTVTLDKDPVTGRLILEKDRKWEQKNYLYPLPAEQVQLNPNLGQNW